MAIRYKHGRTGLSEYPGYYCYDANRPSWLPYWIDDVAESTCKYNPSTIAGNIKACATGDTSCSTPTAAQADPTLSGAGVAAAGEATNVPTCTGFYSLDVASNTCQLGILSNTPLLIGIGLLAIFGMTVIGGGSPRR